MARLSARAYLPFALAAILACDIGGGDGSAADCNTLAGKYQEHLAHLCTANEGEAGASGYCSVCVSAGYASYTVQNNGECICRHLALIVDQCVANIDDQLLLSGIEQSGMECHSFALPSASSSDAAAAPTEAVDADASDDGPSEGG